HQMSGGVVSELPSGFSKNPTNPFQSPTDSSEKDPNTNASGGRIGPFFKFDASRFFQRNPNSPIASYMDGFGATKPLIKAVEQDPCYAYFSVTAVATAKTGNGIGLYSDTDCNKMTDANGTFPQPYVNLAMKDLLPNGATGFRYVNPSSFQIISPGSDTCYGT